MCALKLEWLKNNILTINVFKIKQAQEAGEERNSNTSKSQNMDYIKHSMKFSCL